MTVLRIDHGKIDLDWCFKLGIKHHAKNQFGVMNVELAINHK